MNWKALAVAAVAIVGANATPASAALRTINFTGSWLQIDPSSTSWSAADRISLVVTYDDSIPEIGDPQAFSLDAPGEGLTFTIGGQSWTAADHDPFFIPAPLISFSLPTGPEVLATLFNTGNTSIFSGFHLLFGNSPGAFSVSEIGVPDQAIASFGVLTVDPVPEPASWAMLILGFGLLGAVMRRRRMLVAA
jgi:hypothetical protein